MISWRASHIQRVVLIAGVLTLLLSLLSLKFDTSLLNISRVGVGMFFVLTMGLPYLRILKRKSDLLTGVDGAFGVALSLLMTYPTGVLNIFIEGKQYIYREHLTTSRRQCKCWHAAVMWKSNRKCLPSIGSKYPGEGQPLRPRVEA